MKITALVENRARGQVKGVHGLSLYIETSGHRILFDLGPDDTVFRNARALGIDLRKVDTVILSHGHGDHGGALKAFLDMNRTAKVYAQRTAFEPHYGKALFFRAPIGVDASLMQHPQMVLLDGDAVLDEGLTLFTVTAGGRLWSPMNDRLHDSRGRDRFAHEQNLLIRDGTTALIMGCGHTGVVNILDKAAISTPAVCVGGYHLFDPLTRRTAAPELLDAIATELAAYPEMQFYTCHCTGEKAYGYLAKRLPQMHYLACGEHIEV